MQPQRSMKWMLRFLRAAQLEAESSRDPSTKVGAVIADSKNRRIGSGFNGFPRGVDDHHDRYLNKELKHEVVIHAEVNAILFSNKSPEGCTLYSTFFPCPRCAGIIIQAGITRVVALENLADERYAERIHISQMMFDEAGVSWYRMSKSDFDHLLKNSS